MIHTREDRPAHQSRTLGMGTTSGNRSGQVRSDQVRASQVRSGQSRTLGRGQSRARVRVAEGERLGFLG